MTLPSQTESFTFPSGTFRGSGFAADGLHDRLERPRDGGGKVADVENFHARLRESKKSASPQTLSAKLTG